MREAIGDYAEKRRRLRVAIILLSVVALIVGGLLFYSEHLHQMLGAPEHAIKTHEAQQRIIYGQHYEGLKSHHPNQPIIPPMDQWGAQHKE